MTTDAKKVEILTTPTKETYIEHGGINISVYHWANYEGISLFAHANGADMPVKFSASLKWEEVEALSMALSAARL